MKRRILAIFMSAAMTMSVSTYAFAEDTAVPDQNAVDLTQVVATQVIAPQPEDEMAAEVEAVDTSEKIQYNGEYADVEIDVVEGRMFVAADEIEKVIGVPAEVNGNTVTLTKDGVKVTMVSENKEYTVEKDGVTETKTCDVASHIGELDGDTFYLPVRAIAEDLGLTVGYDSMNNAAVVMDTDAVISKLDGNFEVMNKLMDYSKNFVGKNYKITGEMNLNITVKSVDGNDMVVGVTGEIGGISSDKVSDLNMVFHVDTDKLKAALGQEIGGYTDEEIARIEEMLKDITVDYIMDVDSGKMFFTSSLLSDLLGTVENAWLEIDFNELFSVLGLNMDLSTLIAMSYDGTLEQVMGESLGAVMVNDIFVNSVDAYDSLVASVDMVIAMYGDKAFTFENNRYESNYTDTQEGVNTTMSVGMNVDANGNVVSYDMGMDMSMEGVLSMNLDMAVDENLKTTAVMNYNVMDMIVMDMDMTMEMEETTDTPKTAPDSDVTIISVNDLLGL